MTLPWILTPVVRRCTVPGGAWFGGTQFAKDAAFRWAQFSRNALFTGVKFSEDAAFDWAPTDEVTALLAGQEESHRSGRAEQQFLQRCSGFDARQRSAIRRFLEYMRDEHGEEFPYRQPQVALDRFWSS